MDFLVRGILNTEYGDFNLDGAVDLLDLNKLVANYNHSAGWVDGDASGDGVVGLSDLNKLTANYNFQRVEPVGEPFSLPAEAVSIAMRLGVFDVTRSEPATFIAPTTDVSLTEGAPFVSSVLGALTWSAMTDALPLASMGPVTITEMGALDTTLGVTDDVDVASVLAPGAESDAAATRDTFASDLADALAESDALAVL
jgi:hypothetical protein